MATAREHFALDWIKSDLLETLNDARVALDEYAEQPGDETRLRTCLTDLHQVHGTLVMLELRGVGLLADHLEQLAQAMLADRVENSAAAGQALMQGILELPGYLEELQRGAEDSTSPMIALVNEIRAHLQQEALSDSAGASLTEGATDDVVTRFEAIDGPGKVARIRTAYQNVLLSILKGEDRTAAVATLGKIATGLQRVTQGSALERQWQAFGEFVASLSNQEGVLESDVVKLLRRADVEIKKLAKDGAAALRQPVNMDLVQQLLDATVARSHSSAIVSGLQEAMVRDVDNNTLAISGRQALSSAAAALQEELAVVKDRLDLLVRSSSVDLDQLRQLISPLNQIGSTLSILGFESSREIVADQVDAIENLIVLSDSDPQSIQSIAGALVQIDENLSSVVQGSEQSEVEQITNDAQLQVLRESRNGLEAVKQSVVDFVSTQWDIRHLENVEQIIAEMCGALEIIPLRRCISLLKSCSLYITERLMQGHQPEWAELDHFADAISAVDYYLERLGEETSSGTEDVLVVAERSLAELTLVAPAAEAAEVPTDQVADAPEELAAIDATDATVEEPSASDTAVPESIDDLAGTDQSYQTNQVVTDQPATEEFAPEEPTEELNDTEELIDAEELGAVAAEEVVAAEVDDDKLLDVASIEETADEELEVEADPGFDLASDVFAGLDGVIEAPVFGADEASNSPDADLMAEEAEAEVEVELEISDATAAEELAAAGLDAEAAALEAVEEQEVEEQEVEEQAVEEQAYAAPDVDPEIVEIFVEEVGEVLESIDEWLPQWANLMEAGEPLTEVRRAFHTLKGSGRIVSANAIGELAWAIENMLNRVLDNTVEPNAQFVAVINEARNLFPGLLDAYEAQRAPDLDPMSVVIDRADVLASGGEIQLETAAEAKAAESVATAAQADIQPELDIAAPIDAAVEELTTQPVAEDVAGQLPAVDEVAPLTALPIDEPAADVPAQEPPAVEIAASAAEDESADDTSDNTRSLFLMEAADYLAVIRAENRVQPWTLSESLSRAIHTLAGSAAIADAAQIRLIVEPANQVVEAFRGAPATPELEAFFKATEQHLNECFAAIEASAAWEEPLEFVALADDLLARHVPAASVINRLVDAPATAALFDVEEEFEAFVAGRRDDCPGTLDALYGIASVAGTEMPQIADLGIALAGALQKALPVSGAKPHQQLIRQAHAGLLDQLNEIAAGGTVTDHSELLAELLALEFAPEEVAAPDDEAPQVSEVLVDAPEAEVEDAEAAGEFADVDADLVEVFFEEAGEINDELESAILSWSQEMDNRIYMETMLRGLHTLKGGARLCGLSTLGDMAHDFETVVIEVQNEERLINADLFTELHTRFDAITGEVASVHERFTQMGTGAVTAPVDTPQVEAPSAEPVAQTAEAKPGGAVNQIVENLVSKTATQKTPTPAEVPAPAEAAPAVERTTQEMVRVGSSLLEELVNLAGESSILRARIEQGMSDFTGSLDEMETTIERLREQLRRLEIETETQILHRHEKQEGPQYENFDPLEMDRYNQLQQLSRSLSESASDMLDLKDTLLFKARESETLLLQQARINTELQEGLMRTRMVPFSRLLPRLRRIVRQVANELDKEVELHVQNAEGELDRNLLERMVPPLEHMLRNAVDHGIESAKIRRNFGKPAAGRIDLRLMREGGDVVIEISDDGAGIDVETVRAKAIERELMAQDANLSDEEIMQFVLAPGFTTAKSVTQISGRGVGMDVVHSEVKQLGGSINIVSREGRGTRIILRVPFTVSVNRALMVSVSDDLYAIPLNTIEGIVLLSPEQLDDLYASEDKTFEYAGVPYRVRYLGQYLGREFRGVPSTQTSVPVVLVRSGDHAVAIHVDIVQGSREIVVKSLGPQFAGVGGISGATILGDGSVVVILDLLALIRAQQLKSIKKRNVSSTHAKRPRCVMVVDDSVTVRKVTSRLLERQGMDVLVAKDGIEAVAMLQERRPDIMLLDIEMPRMDGFEVARQIRHDDRLGGLPIVMISSRTGDKHKEHASQLGVNKFLGKPFQENELLATIDDLVGS